MTLIEELGTATGRPVDLVDLKAVREPLLGPIPAKGKRLIGTNAAYAEPMRRRVFNAEDFLRCVEDMFRRRKSRSVDGS